VYKTYELLENPHLSPLKFLPMAVNILTFDDLQQFKTQLFDEISVILKNEVQQPKRWLKTNEVKKLLQISPTTLQTLRINGSLVYSKLGGIIYYDYDHIQKTFTDNQRPGKNS